jgi:hypothetical protein
MTDPFIPPSGPGPAGPRLSARGFAALLGLGWFVVVFVLAAMWLFDTIPIEVAIAVAVVVGIADAAVIYLVGRARRG